MKRYIIVAIAILLVLGCVTLVNKSCNPTKNEEGNVVAEAVQDSANADLWGYMYSHEFVAQDSLTLTFYKDRAEVNGKRVADALQVSNNDVLNNEESVASLTGVSPYDGKIIRLAVVREIDHHYVVDLTDDKNPIMYVEKEVE